MMFDKDSLPKLSALSSDNRRVDDYTRKAINDIQDCFFAQDVEHDLYSILLKYLVGVSLADYAVCYATRGGDKAGLCVSSGFEKITATSDKEPLIDENVLSDWLDDGNAIKHTAYFNSPLSPNISRLINRTNKDCSILLVPVRVHLELKAVVICVKFKQGFSPYVVKRVRPLLSAISCAIHSSTTISSEFNGVSNEFFTHEFINNLISTSQLGIIFIDDQKKIVSANPVAQDIFYHIHSSKKAEYNCPITGYDIEDFVPDYEDLFKWAKQPKKEGSDSVAIVPQVFRSIHGKRMDGSECILDLTIFRYKKHSSRYVILQVKDITEIVANTESYKNTLQQLSALTHLVPVGIIQVDNEWNCVLSNDRWSEFTGLSDASTCNRGWINAFHSEDVEATLELLYNSLNEGKDLSTEVRLVNSAGSVRWAEFSIRILLDHAQNVNGFIGTFADVTDRYVNREKLRLAAEYDSLTGLVNRPKFQDRLEQALTHSKRDQSLVSIFFLDLDGFKDVNDTLGHEAGDKVLQIVAERLVNLLRKTDTVSRFGGDEFIVLLSKDEFEVDVVNVANKVIASFADPFVIDGSDIFLTTSLGIAQGLGEQYTANELIKFADAALYRAKRNGKNMLEIYNSDIDHENQYRVSLMNDLRLGIKAERFNMVYQPICDPVNSNVLGVEALLRFQNNLNETVSPIDFIPLLEESNLIIDVGKWIINEVFSQLQSWMDSSAVSSDFYVAINVSSKELLNAEFFNNIENALAEYKINPKQIVLEITESVLIKQAKKVEAVLKSLRELGIRIALDDFGTGYSSLSYLQKFPIDILKVDSSFVDDLTEGSNDYKITHSIIALADSLNLFTVAEGVETKESLDVLNSLNINSVQGFYFSKGLNEDDLIEYLSQSNKSL